MKSPTEPSVEVREAAEAMQRIVPGSVSAIPEAIGYAVVSFDQVDVSTVSPTERGAIVNWLVTSARIPVYAWSSDDQIFKTWRGVKGRDHHVMPVSIIACTVASTHNSPPDFAASQNTAERDPSVMPDWAGGEALSSPEGK